MGQLDGRVAVITGGSGGIGRAAAKRFVDEGAKVLIVDLEERALRSAVDAIGGNQTSSITADVTSDDDTQRYVQAAVDRYGRLDIYLANAGIEGNIQADSRLSDRRVRSCHRRQRPRRMAWFEVRDSGHGQGRRRQHRDYVLDRRHPRLRGRIRIRDQQACRDRDDAYGSAGMRPTQDSGQHG